MILLQTLKMEQGEDADKVQWMWADAGLVGLKALAKANPLRWSRGTAQSIADELLSFASSKRPVKVRIAGKVDHTFVDATSARKWLLGAMEEQEEYLVPSSNLFLAFSMKILSVPGLAVYLRFLSTEGNNARPWKTHNIFASYSYATQVQNRPHAVRKLQKKEASCVEKRASWTQFFESRDSALVPFIHAAQKLKPDRPVKVVVDAKTFVLVENESDLFCCYGESIDNEVVVAIRGGDSEGRPGDMKRHVGSPVRAYVQGDDCERQPVELLPFAQISKFLKEGKRVTVVAFSQGAIAGIACSFEFREALSRVVLFNSASMFWPPWLDDSSPFSERLFSYVVEGDPLSDGIRNSYVAPRVPGTTVILPTRSSGFENHHLHWFEKGPENCQQAPGNPEENDVVGKVEMTEGLELSRSGDFD